MFKDSSRPLPVDNIRPPSVWTQDENRHTLFMNLHPGFQKEDVKIQFGEVMTVSGERRDDHEIQRFKETYPIPDDYEMMDWTMDKGKRLRKLRIHFHKKKSEITTVENDPSPILESEVHEEGFLKCLWCRVKKKKDLIATAVMAFALGWYMSQ